MLDLCSLQTQSRLLTNVKKEDKIKYCCQIELFLFYSIREYELFQNCVFFKKSWCIAKLINVHKSHESDNIL